MSSDLGVPWVAAVTIGQHNKGALVVGVSRHPAVGLSALFDVFVLGQAVQELLDEGLAGAPLTAAEYAIYSQVFATPGGTPTELAAALSAPLTTVSDWVRTMRARGHLTQVARPQDRRSYGIALSVAGRAAHLETSARFATVYETFLARLPRPEHELRATLAEATATVEETRAVLAERAARTAG
jgi:DNA-binding MarR family transcriptional regulator